MFLKRLSQKHLSKKYMSHAEDRRGQGRDNAIATLEPEIETEAQEDTESSGKISRAQGRVRTKFHGFSPSEANRYYVDGFVQRLAEEAPRDAVIRTEISLQGRAFRGMIHVGSHSGRFFATATSENFHDLGPLLLGRLRKQLDRLRSPRARARHSSLRAGA